MDPPRALLFPARRAARNIAARLATARRAARNLKESSLYFRRSLLLRRGKMLYLLVADAPTAELGYIALGLHTQRTAP